MHVLRTDGRCKKGAHDEMQMLGTNDYRGGACPFQVKDGTPEGAHFLGPQLPGAYLPYYPLHRWSPFSSAASTS